MDRSGIFAQAGFAFQMNVFLKQVTELTPGEVARYEYLDDISASAGLGELSEQAGLSGTQLIQVKNTNVSKQDVVQIYTNWILSITENETISAFVLCYSDLKRLSGYFQTITVDDYVRDLKAKANESGCSNAAKLMRQLDANEIKKLFCYVKDHAFAHPINTDGIKSDIRRNLSSPFHRTSNTKVFEDRVLEFESVMKYNVMSAMSKTEPYEINYEGYMRVCEQICSDISQSRFEPNYAAWRSAVSDDFLQAQEGSREYRQLLSCSKKSGFVTDHMYYCEYYRSLNYERLARCQANIVASLEDVPFCNFRDSKHLIERATCAVSGNYESFLYELEYSVEAIEIAGDGGFIAIEGALACLTNEGRAQSCRTNNPFIPKLINEVASLDDRYVLSEMIRNV